MTLDEATRIGLAALAFAAGEEGTLERLMAETGIGTGDLHARAGDPELLGAVLDFLFSEETLLLDFCRQEGCPPNQVIRARAALPGGPGDWM